MTLVFVFYRQHIVFVPFIVGLGAVSHAVLLLILGERSVEKTKNIWCAKDPLAAWQGWMQKQTEPAAAECD